MKASDARALLAESCDEELTKLMDEIYSSIESAIINDKKTELYWSETGERNHLMRLVFSRLADDGYDVKFFGSYNTIHIRW